uniref:Uncharacterized protein n=1 Tax=Kalanchoe fedtschenkoi TaxID=63787 RepID=A0A7N0UDW5_KALFE
MAGDPKPEQQDGTFAQSPCHALPSSASSLSKEQSHVDLELKLLEGLEKYPPAKLQGVHRHFVLFGLMEYLRRSFGRGFSSDEVLQLVDRFYNLEYVKPDDDEMECFTQLEEFRLPQTYFDEEA